MRTTLANHRDPISKRGFPPECRSRLNKTYFGRWDVDGVGGGGGGKRGEKNVLIVPTGTNIVIAVVRNTIVVS